MKIMGRVAWLILLVVMSVCVVFCVLCGLQNNPVFSSVTYLIISKNEKYELCTSAGFFVTTGKIKVLVVCPIELFCLAVCAVVSVFGSGDYDQKK